MAFRKIFLVKPGVKRGLGFVHDVIPTGLEYIASSIEKEVEKIWLLDMEFETQSFQSHLDAFKPDLVGLTISATDHDQGLRLAEQAKRSGATTVLGGYHATAVPDELLSHKQVDIIIRGEGEITMRELIRAGSPIDIVGASYKVGGQIIHNDERPPTEDLDKLPFPARHLRRHQYRNRMNRDDREFDVITASRGCWGTCVFCCEPYMSKSCMRFRSPENIMAELSEISRYHRGRPLHILATDPHFIGDPKRLDHLCDLLHEKNMDVTFSVMTRPDSIALNPELVAKMCDNGILNYELGIESPRQEELDSVKKGITLETQRRAVKILRENGANVAGTLVIGLPDQDKESIKEFPAYAKDIGLMSCAFGIATPFPGTEFYEGLEAKELIFQRDWTKYDEMHSVFRLDSMSPEELEQLESYCMGRFWTLNTFLDREGVMQKRVGKKLSLGGFAEEVMGKLVFVKDAGDDVREGGIKDHVESFLDAMIDAEAEESQRSIPVQDIIETSRFLRILGSQTIQLMLTHGEKSAGYMIKTNGQGVDFIKIIEDKQADATINIDVDLDRMIDAYEKKSTLSIINSVSTLRSKRDLGAVVNLLRLYAALTTEIGSTYMWEKLRVIG
ncbi:MAG: radical SAM protein [Candidatus Bathyarchaeota archaeon]|nr:radical SAM protein [Candidatus Bathyarchaeota archaeon]